MRVTERCRWCWLAALPAVFGLAIDAAHAGDAPTLDPAAAATFFETKVRPVLAEHCFKCHGPEKQKANLRLDSQAAILEGGDSGSPIVPGQPEDSLLIDAINHGEIVQMPPTGKLPPQTIADLTAWVKSGAPWPSDQSVVKRSAEDDAGYQITAEDKAFWVFQPPRKPPLPPVRNTEWPKSPVDHFILAPLESKGLRPAPPVDDRTLIRRVTFDLTGLPPTPEEVEAFLQDDSTDAFATVVGRLLASPHYGERWGRHWLDVSRYADSNGADENRLHANAWRYRDYVVAAFNDDQPFDQFVIEQLAGDLLPARDREERNRNWIATGFLAIGPKPLLANDAAKVELDVVDEQIDATGRAFLGLTLGCARCHDHKFDPIPASDYYALAGIFKSTTTIDRYDFQNHRSWTERALGSDEEEAEHQRLKAEYDLANELRRLTDGADKQKPHIARMAAVRKELGAIPVAMAVKEGNVANAHVLIRGNHLTPGPEAPRGFPRILAGDEQTPIGDEQSGRLDLARWLVQPDHPLTARVMVNRIWKWHFGEGIVRSVDNFGRLGERPDNQPLLDYLAVQFVESGWSIKAMHRLIVLSSTYQQSSNPQSSTQSQRSEVGSQKSDSRSDISNLKSPIRNPQLIDPENRLLWRMNRRRLDAEEIRDAMLLVSGQLDLTVGGAMVPPEVNYERVSDLNRKKGGGPLAQAYQSARRSLYLPVSRSGLYDLFQVFDFADPSVVTGRRETTTVAPQTLFLMNSDLVWQSTEHLANRLLHTSPTRQRGGEALSQARRVGICDDAQRVHEAYERAYSRPPGSNEISRALDFIQQYEDELAGDGLSADVCRASAWQAWCRVVLTSTEFMYVE
ncbi:MAG: PSD1 domain-containing protein [Planctomycetes bacterium]|nr:PSD1 domain-containing protein [Planctomycetota bacterium]